MQKTPEVEGFLIHTVTLPSEPHYSLHPVTDWKTKTYACPELQHGTRGREQKSCRTPGLAYFSHLEQVLKRQVPGKPRTTNLELAVPYGNLARTASLTGQADRAPVVRGKQSAWPPSKDCFWGHNAGHRRQRSLRVRPNPSRIKPGTSTNPDEHVPEGPEHPHPSLGRPALAGLTRVHPRTAAPPENPLQPGLSSASPRRPGRPSTVTLTAAVSSPGSDPSPAAPTHPPIRPHHQGPSASLARRRAAVWRAAMT